MSDLGNILICANDSGGANQIYYWYLKNRKKYNFYFYLSGPAKKLFNRNNTMLKKIKKLHFDKIITGTSINSDIEKKIRFYFKEHKNIITFLDHYINYKVRFFYKGKYHYPNEIWCSDKFSFHISKKIFKQIRIKLVKNYYKIELLKQLGEKNNLKFNNKKNVKALFLSEPFNNRKYYKNEREIIEKMIKFLQAINVNVLTIRLHPSEKNSKFNFLKKIILRNSKINVKLDKEKTIFKSFKNNKYIIGVESYALVISSYGKKKTFTLLPHKNFRSSLPHKSIVSVNNYI